MIAQKLFASPDDPEFSKRAYSCSEFELSWEKFLLLTHARMARSGNIGEAARNINAAWGNDAVEDRYGMVLMRRELWSEERKDKRITAIDDMLAELCERSAIRPLALVDLPGFQMIPFESGDNEIEDDFAHQINFIPNSGNSETAMNGIWTHTTSLNAAMDVRNNFILEESPESYSNIPSASSYQEELLPYAMNPYVMIPTTVSEISEDSTCVSSEAASSHGQSMDDISEHLDQATCTQEDILQEIMAHIDRLVDIRDRTNRKENDVKLSITSEQSSLSENSSDEPRQLNNIFLDDMTDDQSQRPDDIAEIAEMGRQPGHNSSEEEFSYNDNNHNENNNSRQTVADLEIRTMLTSVFPVSIVDQVLLMNGSRNIDFLANQCAELCA
ncbi:hypothetical protein KIN20_001276 [Parelaphostrongylus tenuis]|uniref:Uncharacterized protein n=1 Tax=Parelaphostrongylus tenuis TaxID=148309 RepID=A0AAD5MF07_PARTN|nr:hypothetical protein KIN20_001276 [Parelaphostrongylus tenuis]